jgi:hypothetical protein
MSLNMLAKKDGGIPDISKLSSTPYSSLQIRSEKKSDGAEEWSFASRQHDPKTMLQYESTESPTFSGGVKTRHTHKESVAQFAIYPQGENGKLSQKQIECIEKGAMGKSNGEMIGSSIGAASTPAIMQVPIIGPVASGVWFGLARKKSGELGNSIATQWNDC